MTQISDSIQQRPLDAGVETSHGNGAPPEQPGQAERQDRPEQPEKKKIDMVEMAVTFVSPALFGKLLILYFGSNYSSKPGQGYGIGLCLSISFTLVMLFRFVWRYKDYAEEE